MPQVVAGNVAVDGGAVVGVPPVTQTPTMAGADNPNPQLPMEWGVKVTGNLGGDQNNHGPNAKGKGVARYKDPYSLQCFRCQGWGYMARECPTPVLALNQPGGTEGMQLTPTGDSCPSQL